MGSLIIERLGLGWRWTVICAIGFVLICLIIITTLVQPYPEKYGINICDQKEETLLEVVSAG
jgi:predicted MFS family arabinose efflux permease